MQPVIERLGRWLYANSRHYANSRNMPITHRTASICAHSALLVNTPHGVISNQFECNCVAPNIYYLSRLLQVQMFYPSRFDFDCKTTSSNKFQVKLFLYDGTIYRFCQSILKYQILSPLVNFQKGKLSIEFHYFTQQLTGS